MEGLLSRIAHSPYGDDFILKGGVLLAAFSLRRPTKDIDLQAAGIPNDVDEVRHRISEIAAVEVDDGLIFQTEEITAETIRDDDEYAGVRLRLSASLGRARLRVGIDVNFGDPIWPRPTRITLPRLIEIGQEPVYLLGYPLSMVVAEKTVTFIDRGEANTRWRDYADVLMISRRHELRAEELSRSLSTVAQYRSVQLRPLLPALAGMSQLGQGKWANWRQRNPYVSGLPDRFAEILQAVASFVDPVLRSEFPDGSHWAPGARQWVS